MSLGHDATWWGLALAIAAIVLAIPLTIIGNFMTPTVALLGLRWTDRSLAKQIARFEAQFTRLEADCPVLTTTEEQLLKGVLCIAQLLSFCMEMAALGAWILAFHGLTQSPLSGVAGFVGLIGCGFYFMSWVWRRNTIIELKKHYSDHSPKYRAALKKALEDLKAVRDRHP